jgi:hypothetical protein
VAWLIGAVAVIVIMILAVNAHSLFGDDSSYQAGYQAAEAGGSHSIHVMIDEGGLTPFGICTNLHQLTYTGPTGNLKSPYDYNHFMDGCLKGIDHVYGSHVPALPGAR